jgi:spore germination protein
MKRMLVCLLVNCLALAACTQKEIIDQITMPIVVGYDKAKHNQIQMTVAVPIFRADQSVSNKIYSSASHTIKNARERLRAEIRKPFSVGKLSVTLYSKDLAKEGLARILDPSLRDPRISKRNYLAVVDGQAKDLLESDFSLGEEKGVFLNELIENKIRVGHLPRTNLHQFEYFLLGKGMDPYLPLLKKQKENVSISGLALFKHDKYVAAISLDQMRIFRLLLEDVDHGTYEVELDHHSYAIVDNRGSKVRYQISGSAEKPEVTINLTLSGETTEFSGFVLTERDLLNIEKRLEQQIANTGKSLLHTFQELRVDPLGIGDFVRSQTRNWEEAKWEQQYPHTPIHLNVDVDVVETGATDGAP